MREILFRGKRIGNGEWVEGFYVMYSKSIAYPYSYTNGEHNIVTVPHNFKYEIDFETICQYTGLTDKNGKKIFDGDIVKTKFFGKCRGDFNFADYDIFQIVYEKGAFYFENQTRRFLIDERAEAEIIGNVFDNPELLEVQE